MKRLFCVAALLLAPLCNADTIIVLTIAKVDETSIIKSAGKIPQKEFAIPLEDFLGKSVTEGLSFFGTDNILRTENCISHALSDATDICSFTYDVENKQYKATFMKMIQVNGYSEVNILIDAL